MEDGVLPVTAVGRNGTACPHCCHQHLEKGLTVERKICVCHTLSLWWCNPSALCINALCIHVCACKGSPVLEQARRARDVPRRLHHESAAHLRSGLPPDPAGTRQKPPGQHASRPAMPWEWSEKSQLLPVPHQIHQGFLLSPQLVAAWGRIAHPLLQHQATRQTPHVPLIAEYTWNETARYHSCQTLV